MNSMQPNYYPQQQQQGGMMPMPGQEGGMNMQQPMMGGMPNQGGMNMNMQNPQMMMNNNMNNNMGYGQQPQMMNQQQPQMQQPQMMNQQQPQMQQPQLQQPQMQGNNSRGAPQAQSMQSSRQPQPQQQQPRGNGIRSMMSRPPYVDPNTNIIYETDNAEYEGFLTKQSMWLRDWRRRFFLLKGSKLFYCSNEYSAPHGMIDLALCTTVKSADLKSRKRNSFEISTPEITYLLYADTEQEKDDWIGRVGKAIVRCSSTYYNAKGKQPQNTATRANLGGPYGAYNQQSAMDSDDDDIYYEDPNNPLPYFND